MSQSMQVPVTVSLPEKSLQDIASLVEGDAPLAHKVQAFANTVLDQLAHGAIVLPREIVDRMTEIDPGLDNPEAILDVVEQNSGVDEGDFVIRWPIDPAMTEPIRERATINGITPQQLIQDMMNNGVAQGWFYDLDIKVRTFFITHDQAAQVAAVLGTEHFSGDDLVNAVLQSSPAAEAEAQADLDKATEELFGKPVGA